MYYENCENLIATKKYLPKGIFVDRQYSADIENKRRILRPIYKAAKNHPSYRGRYKMENEFLKIHGRRYSVNNIKSLPEELSRFKCTSKETPTELGFFGKLNPLSDFYSCEFTLSNLHFHNREQMIQYNKAKHFKDHVTMSQILYAETPLECKQLSREIVNYDEGNWKMVAKNICMDGLTEKFIQNPSLAETLLNTEEKCLVECSYDKLWGTGVPLSDTACLN